MVESIPKHLLEKISLLYTEFKTNQFRFQEAVKILGQSNRYTGGILSSLEKAGWISKARDKEDGRKRIYQIKNIEEIIDLIGQNLKITKK